MDNQDDNKTTDQSQDDKQEVKISPQTPVRIDEFTLGDIFDSETIKMGVKALITLMEQSAENDKAKNDIAKKQLENQIELRRLDIEEQKLDIQAEQQEQRHIKWFDVRNKVYTVGILLVVIVASVLLKSYDILDKNEARTIIIIALTIGMTSNTDLIKKLFSGKKDD